MSKLTLIRGIPGSGKSTYAKNNYQCCILENDMFQIVDGKYVWSPEGTRRAIDQVMALTDQILSSGADVVVANTFTKVRFVEAYKRIADRHGADIEVIRCTGSFKNVHNVPQQILENMRDNFENWPGEKMIYPEYDK